MDINVDDQGDALFSDEHEHRQAVYADLDGEKIIDIIKTCSNIWFAATQVMDVMGMNAAETKNTSRVLNRIDHPDIIKIKDTPFRFSDGRRNRGSFISARAVMIFADGKTKNFNPIKANAFVDWMNDEILEGHDADHWSPAKQEVKVLDPVFRKVTYEQPDDDPNLDPLRPIGRYLPLIKMPPLQSDEVEFCFCEDERNGLGKCWCRGKGGIKTYVQQRIERAGLPDCVIDDDDVFEVTTETVTLLRIKTKPVRATPPSA